ncbi:hypothetical protein [Flavobacterium sp. DG2-3]|uniref:hypothetical protein n=1 Tax=Flavobacterium sp. DG2-3 TaxID=3068317 RepID=UPI00273DD2C6|nr:hypothetical protein [Flavobacterium sp. DG2-3]MDP5200393.1 hypothetical protein [Flavobacterium sp. DG2-3]
MDARTINFGTNVQSVNVSITATVTTSYNEDPTALGKIAVYYKRNSHTQGPSIPTNGFDGSFQMMNGRTQSKTFKITLYRSDFDDFGGNVYVQYSPPGNTLLNYKSDIINVTKIPDPISNNVISGNQTINEGQSTSAISGSTPSGGDGTFIYTWQQKVANGSWMNISGATNKNYSPGVLTSTTSYRRIVTSAAYAVTSTSNEVTVTVISLPTIENNVITLNGNNISGSLPTGGTGTYQYSWIVYIDEVPAPDGFVIEGSGQNLEIPSWLHNEYWEGENIKWPMYIYRRVASGNKFSDSNWVEIPLLNSNRTSLTETNLQSELDEIMTVYPNPTSEEVNFATNFSTNKEINIVVYSDKLQNEKSVFRGVVEPNQVVNWNIPSGYQKGLYYYKILSGNKKVKSGKIIIR